MYAAVVLGQASTEALRKFHVDGWKFYAHHMTIQFGEIPSWVVEGTVTEMTVVAIGQNDLVRAAKVIPTTVPSTNKVPHVTISVAPEGKPVMSNDITEWTEVPPFTVRGVVSIERR